MAEPSGEPQGILKEGQFSMDLTKCNPYVIKTVIGSAATPS